jgi:peptidyl-prolyl cis-trans isomerase SurA
MRRRDPSQPPQLCHCSCVLVDEGNRRTLRGSACPRIAHAVFRFHANGGTDVSAHRRLIAHAAAILALALGVWAWPFWQGTAGAQTVGKWTTTAKSSAETKSTTTKSNNTKSNNTKSSNTKSSNTKPTNAKSAEAKSIETNSIEVKSPPSSRGGQGIVIVVNDDAITAYDIEQRARLLGLSSNVGPQAKEAFQRLVKSESTEQQMKALQQEVIRSNQGKTREQLIAIFQERQKEFGIALQKQALESARATLMPKLKTEAKEELIEDRLKLQAAKKLGIEVSDQDIKTVLTDLAGRNKMSYDQFADHLKGSGVDISTMGEKFRAQKAWRDLVGRRYAAQISVTQRDVDRVLSAAATESGEDTVELQVQRISLKLAGKIDQSSMTKRYAEAEALRRRFSGCKGMAELAKGASDTSFEDMKYVKPASIAEPMRSMLLSAKDDDVLPPVTTSAGVELYAVCGRRAAGGNEEKRSAAMAQLQSKELDVLARRHLRNLRQEANIEYK